MNDKINIKRPGQILDYVDTKEHLVDLFNYINQLQSNWNSLREYIKTEWNVVVKSPDGSFYDGYDTCLEEMKKDILDKMNELEGKDKDNGK